MCPVSEQAIKHRLSNYNDMSILLLQRSHNRKKKVKEGINFILSYFPKHNVFPRAICIQALTKELPIIIHNKNEMFRTCEQFDFIGYKVRTYPDLLLANFQAYFTDRKKIPGKKGEVGGEKTTVCYHFR